MNYAFDPTKPKTRLQTYKAIALNIIDSDESVLLPKTRTEQYWASGANVITVNSAEDLTPPKTTDEYLNLWTVTDGADPFSLDPHSFKYKTRLQIYKALALRIIRDRSSFPTKEFTYYYAKDKELEWESSNGIYRALLYHFGTFKQSEGLYVEMDGVTIPQSAAGLGETPDIYWNLEQGRNIYIYANNNQGEVGSCYTEMTILDLPPKTRIEKYWALFLSKGGMFIPDSIVLEPPKTLDEYYEMRIALNEDPFDD